VRGGRIGWRHTRRPPRRLTAGPGAAERAHKGANYVDFDAEPAGAYAGPLLAPAMV
jgi:hypothetical protein